MYISIVINILLYSPANSSLCAYFGKYWEAQNMANWSTWPNQFTPFCINIALSLLSLEHNSGQTAALRPISPIHLLFFIFFCIHTSQTARANNGHSSMHTSNKHIEHSASYIHLLEVIGQLVYNIVCLFVWFFLWCTPLSMLNVKQHTCNKHIEHWTAYMQ